MNSFLPARLNFPLWRGATFRYLFQWLDSNGKERKPHEMYNFTGECQLLGPFGEVLFELKGDQATEKPSDGIKFPEAAEEEPKGFVELYIDAKETEDFTWKKASYTLFLTEPFKAPEPDVFPMLSGVFTVSTSGSIQ